jgi:SAM-dependent methyltransferase
MRSILTRDIALRRVEPEILDDLQPDDPDAIASRRDLARLNALMFNARIMAALLQKHVADPPRRILEIGAGDGTFMLAVGRRLAGNWPKVDLMLLDRVDLISRECRDGFDRLGWRAEAVTADIFEWLGRNRSSRFDVITANLCLHHFDDAELARLFSALQPLAPVFLAAEPCRAAFPLAVTRRLWLLGANQVTLHDAAVSVRAGFTGTELSDLWPSGPGAPLEERRAGLFTHVFAGAGLAAAGTG